MIQVCDPPRTRQVRRLSAEEFCQLAQSEVSSVYRPRSEVMRMLTVGEVWGMYSTRGVPGAGCILLPMDANVAAAAALRLVAGHKGRRIHVPHETAFCLQVFVGKFQHTVEGVLADAYIYAHAPSFCF